MLYETEFFIFSSSKLFQLCLCERRSKWQVRTMLYQISVTQGVLFVDVAVLLFLFKKKKSVNICSWPVSGTVMTAF